MDLCGDLHGCLGVEPELLPQLVGELQLCEPIQQRAQEGLGAARLAGRGRTVDEYREQLRTMNFRSLLGPYRVDETGLQTGKPIFILQWQDGRRELVYPEDFAREPILYPFPAWSGR